MNKTTLFGIIAGTSLILIAIFLGGAVDTFVNVPGFFIVVGGTLAAICVNYPLNDIIQAHTAAFKIFLSRKVREIDVVNTMVKIADISRREGLLALENIKTENMILKKACQLIADNADPMLIREMLAIEIASLRRRHHIVHDVFKRMGAYAPSFGMIGTLIGLVQMLASLHDPSSIGPAMAVALLTTFYGAMMASLVFLPVAGKLRSQSQEEVLHLYIIFEGAKCILENNNPRLVYEKLSSFVPPKDRRSER
ncbi:motility protein A [Desulfonatronum thiodismutans]|uniref:motility protein A n=1 Tax=Desulfonatronum thiodismutans TaxID=159290 RepID=UPI0004ABEA89|nr:MotA/TolQ/ExbB proton channel family protein [Desulfonatronum thiodismutans]